MSCGDESNCQESLKRRRALAVFGLMMVFFIALSAFSFLGSRGQVTPDTITYGTHQADEGKRIFQAYNCMGCHTMVGNGAYFAPDLTETYELAGPAWLAAFLPSAGGWPTEAAVRTQLANAVVSADAGVSSIEEYYTKFPGTKERIERRGGHKSLMPNLPFQGDEVPQLIAYLKYTSAMDTEGWPPKVLSGALNARLAHLKGAPVAATASAAPAAAPAAAVEPAAVDPVARGEALATEYACTACHAADSSKLVGPGWGGLHGHDVSLADGSTVEADDAYLAESIRTPDAKLVAGYTPGTMPAYAELLSDDDVNAIVAYIRSLEAK
ncbi:MAG: cytochrome c [Xanthomonadales bacterium]|nr:cytochrome c [Xanthomonadales bacterium]